MDIELRGITKRFGEVVANSDVNLNIRAGEILGLLGENGAGKTTLMNILSGLYRADEGEILIDGKPTYFHDAKDAIHAGIGMVHQHFMLVPVFTVAENVVLGVEPTGALDHLDMNKAREQVRSISSQHGLEVDPDAVIEEIPVGIQQRVEIIKVLFRSASVLIFDEPTAVLTPQEVDEFFGIVRSLRDAGKALVFITHKLHEVLEVADRINVLRAGKIVGEADPKTATEAELAEMMVGRPVRFDVDKKPFKPGRPLLEVAHLRVLNERDEVAVERCQPDRARARGRRHRRRAGQRPDRAGRGADRPAAGDRRQGRVSRRRHHPRLGARRGTSSASRTSRRTGSARAWSASSTSPRTWSSTATTTSRYSTGITHALGRGQQGLRQERHRFRRAHAVDLQRSPTTFPAATSRS